MEKADLEWKEGTPVSRAFDDIYYSKDSALDEIEHVFLEPNEVLGKVERRSDLNIGELGFGTGLNLIYTIARMRELWEGQNKVIHFYSVEKYPLQKEDYLQAYQFWPHLKNILLEIIEPLSTLSQGWNQIKGPDFDFKLWVGEVSDFLVELQSETEIHVWYLDGFAPSKNPDMWSQDVLDGVAKNSSEGTSFSTFTAVGNVRRGLIQAGFDVEKVPGYGRKREMLRGEISP